MADELDAEELAGASVAGVAHRDRVAAGVVGLVVVGFGRDGERGRSRLPRLRVAQAGAGGDEVEDLDDLGAEAAGELAGAAEGVLAGDPALLVGGRSEREVAGAEEAVVGDHAVAGREDVGEVGAHLPVDDDRSPGFRARLRRRPRAGCRGVPRPTTSTRSAGKRSGSPSGLLALTSRRSVDPGSQLLDRVDAGVARHVDAVLVELGADECAELWVDGWQHLRELLDLGHGEAAGDERFGHLEPDVSGADDHRPSDLLLFERVHQGEGVAHRVQQVHTLARAEVGRGRRSAA